MADLGLGTEYYLFGGAGLISLLAFGALILVPALGAYGRTWEKATAVMLSVFVLVALVMLGVAIGVLIVYYWPQITQILPGVG
jgi:O-antigen ligase